MMNDARATGQRQREEEKIYSPNDPKQSDVIYHHSWPKGRNMGFSNDGSVCVCEESGHECSSK